MPEQFNGCGRVLDWHDPRNDGCFHNQEGGIGLDCTCKRKVNRKPYRVVRATDNSVGHGIRPQFVAELWPNGRLVIREAGRRLRVETTLGSVYEQCLMREARKIVLDKRKARAERRKATKLARRIKK